MSTVTGVIWKTTILNTTFGWYGVLAKAVGLAPVDLLSYYPLPVIIFFFAGSGFPFLCSSCSRGSKGFLGNWSTACASTGSSGGNPLFGWLPLIMNHIRVAVMLGLVFIVKEFGLILVTTAGGPGTRSYTLPYQVYMQIFSASNVGRAGALATMTVVLTLIAVNFVSKSMKKNNL